MLENLENYSEESSKVDISSTNQEQETPNKYILNRVLDIVNEFQWPKSKISVHYTRRPIDDIDNSISPVINEPLYTKAKMTDLPVSSTNLDYL